MTNNPNELTIENSVLVLIDHQPWVAFAVHSIDPGLMINNFAGLARAARDLCVPTVLTTVGAQGSILADPIFKEISEVFPDVTPIDRTSTCLVARGRPGRHRRYGPQEIDHGRPRDRGVSRPVRSRSSQGRVRRLFRQ
jgi:hypothetical protein